MSERAPSQTRAGGIGCMEVLEGLPDYLEDRMDPPLRAAVDAHLQACGWCARFGGRYAAVVSALQARAPDPLEEALARRLSDALDAALDAQLPPPKDT